MHPAVWSHHTASMLAASVHIFACAAWQQHDVQELCRVMFDALERKWKNTDQADLINRLYQGQMKDYVKCLEVGLYALVHLVTC